MRLVFACLALSVIAMAADEPLLLQKPTLSKTHIVFAYANSSLACLARWWVDAIADEKAIWQVVVHYARATTLGKLAPHDLRRTCAKLCRKSGGELK